MPRLIHLALAPQRAEFSSSTVPNAVVKCLMEDRRPTREEIEAVAAKIWNDGRGGTDPRWRQLVAGSRDRQRMIALARGALRGTPLRDPWSGAGLGVSGEGVAAVESPFQQ